MPPAIGCCFLCKGDDDPLRACDFSDCPKMYHPSCLENKYGFLPSPDEEFICDWHACFKSMKKNKKTYIGWGSDKLMYFLSTLGKETSKSCDEDELAEVVMAYIKQKNLFDNNKKKTFLCDDVLHPLFGRRKVRCKSIRRFLARHLTANAVSEDENFDGSEDEDTPVTKKKPRFDGSEDDAVGIMGKEPWSSLEFKIAKKVLKRNKRHFASLNENNINLIYLRRSLIINLSKHPDTFDQKVVGCFVRVKNGTSVHIYEMPKKPFQLGLVTGIKRSSEEYKINDICTNILLCVTGFWDDVKISMLSDGKFDEEECNDLVSLVKKGLLKRPTIAALEEKVAIVHKDIVNHWIDKELVRLDREIDRANIKGWRAEYPSQIDCGGHILINCFSFNTSSFFPGLLLLVHFLGLLNKRPQVFFPDRSITFEEKMQQLKLLSTEAERMHLLEEVPDIIADTEQEGNETELEVTESNSSQENAGAAEDVDESLRVHKEKQTEGKRDSASCFIDVTENSEAGNILKCLRAYEDKSIEGNTNTLLLPSSPGVTQRASSSNNLEVQPIKDAADDAVKSLGVDKEKSTKGLYSAVMAEISGSMYERSEEMFRLKYQRRRNKKLPNVSG